MFFEPHRVLIGLALSQAACVLVGCSAPAPNEANSRLAADARALVVAPPATWPERVRAVLAHGPEAAGHLVTALQEAPPEAPGRRAALAALGALGGPSARAHLEAVARSAGPAADEAALALGRLPRAQSSIDLLRKTARDRNRGSVIRAAAVAALLDLRAAAPLADLVEAILVAGTPQGIGRARRLGLPQKTRWALERHLLIEAIRRRTKGEDFGLDPDAPWPRLVEGAGAFVRWLRDRERDQG